MIHWKLVFNFVRMCLRLYSKANLVLLQRSSLLESLLNAPWRHQTPPCPKCPRNFQFKSLVILLLALLQTPPYRFWYFFPLPAPSFLAIWLVNSSKISLPNSKSPQGSTFLNHSPESVSRQNARRIIGLTSFVPCLSDPVLPVVQYLEAVFHVFQPIF